ncbi:nucleotidyltransferase domain-containing protein [Paenibacillus soyae]|uniref:Nucleotidyltransferase family protein n=1 Tax=Paenibacillus soyae TaxID=2969249 RepID=A0A9X2MX28_9BACL|nr:nucleotidyltransferase family protein [Paenibacillus soyae]MCR2807391.1 nucleotidyltransferase family protein [Paenibacillus soyae]
MISEPTNDLMPELRFVIACLTVDPDKRLERMEEFRACSLDFHLVYQLSIHHRVYPLVYRALKELTPDWIPESLLKDLSSDYKWNTIHMVFQENELEKIHRLFDQANIRLLSLKGPFLAECIYGEISLRTCKDMDVMISLVDFDEANRILVELGYKPDIKKKILNSWKWNDHHLSYIHPGKGLEVELHWRLNPEIGFEPSFDELWSRRRVLAQRGVPYMGSEDLFMFLATHGARHAWFRLRWLMDIVMLLRSEINWDLTLALWKKYHALIPGGQTLLLANRLFGSPIPEVVRELAHSSKSEEMADKAMVFITEMTDFTVLRERAVFFRKYLYGLRTGTQRFSYILSQLYPNWRDAETLPLPKSLHILYFPLRPFLFLYRRLKFGTMED